MIQSQLRGHIQNPAHVKKWFQPHVDWLLLCSLLLLTAFGLFVLYSATQKNFDMVYRQLMHFALGFCALLVIAQIQPTTLYRLTPWLYLFVLFLLIMVLVGGDIGKGAKRWLQIGMFRFQPSELMKLAVPLAVSWYFHHKPSPPGLFTLIVSLIIILLPTLLIAVQPDLGTSLLIASSGFAALLFTGIRWRWFIFSGALAACCAPLLWFALHDYQKRRIMTFLNPESDPLGSGWNIIQSKITIGSGGLFGKGWLQGTQSQLQFLPESSTDFIFSVLSEELGLIGVIALLTVYLCIICRGLYISAHAQDTFGRLLTASLTLTFFVYIFVNIGMVSGLLPVVGLPLPMVSYGGTSIVSMLMGFGLMMSIQTHRKLLSS